jgi:hypothetical protein
MSHATFSTSSNAAVSPSVSLEPDRLCDWAALRRAVDAKESDLRSRTIKWLATLPASTRPMATARQYSRIVNRIGDLWSHDEFTRLFFQSLLIDRRSGRQGFPPVVRQELELLQHYYFVHMSKLPEVLWRAVPITAPKIPQRRFPPLQTGEIEILPP